MNKTSPQCTQRSECFDS